MKYNIENIKQTIIKLCEEKNISVNKLATKADLTQSTIDSILKGKSINPQITTLEKIASGFDMTLDDFLSYDTTIDNKIEMFVDKLIRDTKSKKIIWSEDDTDNEYNQQFSTIINNCGIILGYDIDLPEYYLLIDNGDVNPITIDIGHSVKKKLLELYNYVRDKKQTLDSFIDSYLHED